MSLQSSIDNALAQTSPGRPVWVAVSGGLDSCLLLTLAASAARRHPRTLYALHVNHGLQAAAREFETHCRRLCSRLGVPLFVERIEVSVSNGLGVEGAAREARYAAFARRVAIGDTLWLAQHRRDQAETFLLAALRGSGVRGLAAMPHERDWRGRCLIRPWLDVPRATLEDAASRSGLEWIEDPSNTDQGLDRNFLRHRVLPLLESRWPATQASLAQAASLAGEADILLGDLAALDLAAAGGDPGCLSVASLAGLSPPRQRLLIRDCCARLGLALPGGARLSSLLDQLEARYDAEACVAWEGGEGRIWRGALYLQAPFAALPADWQTEWDGAAALQTPVGRLTLGLQAESGERCGLWLRARQGGERLELAHRGRRDLKRLLQEWEVPPWQRSRLLVAWHGDRVAAVLGEGLPGGGVTSAGWRLLPGAVRAPAENRPSVDTRLPARDR
ncbi:tRNA lysidine(34) synthetase TilS [Litchfieldella rifensis]|uniref:tRNA(Ile)-lysidine synthase n=1 Tax=Litchfieldella rifensis TaxID=762643 RepID=A0ABV7LRR5_9GAMM